MSWTKEQTGCSDKLTLDDGHDGALLDSRGALETVGVDTTEELSLEVHGIEGVGGLIVVGLDLSCSAGSSQRSSFQGGQKSRDRFCRRRGSDLQGDGVRDGEQDGRTLGDLFKTGSHDCGLRLFVGGWWMETRSEGERAPLSISRGTRNQNSQEGECARISSLLGVMKMAGGKEGRARI